MRAMFEIRVTQNGKSVFSKKHFKKGDIVMKFFGKLFSGDELPNPYDSVEDHYLQVGKKLYLGPSGSFDDFVNHSCDPNTALVIEHVGEPYIKAIKDVLPEDEITWDYSTSIDEASRASQLKGWEMRCLCGSQKCRGIIGDFRFLPEDIKQKYFNEDIFPTYIKEQIVAEAGGILHRYD